MKLETAEQLKQTMISCFKKIGDDKGLLIKGKRSYTGNELVQEIEDETEVGIDLMEGILKLSIDLLKRDKINIDG